MRFLKFVFGFILIIWGKRKKKEESELVGVWEKIWGVSSLGSYLYDFYILLVFIKDFFEEIK